jgi:hypothetical protein
MNERSFIVKSDVGSHVCLIEAGAGRP